MRPDAILRAIKAATDPLYRRLVALVKRGLLMRVKYEDNLRLLQVKLPGGQEISELEHIEPFGFTSHAGVDAEALVLSFAGNSTHSVGLMVHDRRYRMEIAEGEVAIYNAKGDYLRLNAEGTATLKATEVVIESGSAQFTGDVSIEKTLTVTDAVTFEKTLDVTELATLSGDAKIADITYSEHVHGYTDDGAPADTEAAKAPGVL